MGAGAGAIEAAARLLGARARRDAPLGALTTYRVGGRAGLLVEVAQEADLAAVREAVTATGVPVLVVGKGSNLLVADAGFPGLAVVVGEGLSGVEVDTGAARA
ncbi:MAG: FAD-binding protein, partial [Acidimicrobiales bacterium]